MSWTGRTTLLTAVLAVGVALAGPASAASTMRASHAAPRLAAARPHMATPVTCTTPTPQPIHIRDFNGDGKSDLGVFRPSTGFWYINGVGTFHYGNPGDGVFCIAA